MEEKKLVCIALGGNAILRSDEKGTFEDQYKNVSATCTEIIKIIKMGYNVILTHGKSSFLYPFFFQTS
jgi:carbamate kinase